MSVGIAAKERDITELLHYTTSPGILGVLHSRKLLSRQRVEGDEDVAFIRETVWPRRKPLWDDHISLSVSRINSELHSQSEQKYPDHWWGILSFSIELLDDENVWFATCNNFFPSCARAQFADGFQTLFADPVEGKYQRNQHRSADMAQSWTTDRTAEVLYPGEIPLARLQRIYVKDTINRSQILAWAVALSVAEIEVVVAPLKFE